MEEELIIRKEADEFHKLHLTKSPASTDAIHIFKKVKERLYDFYSAESKAIFLDQIEIQMQLWLDTHVSQAHAGTPDASCFYEKKINTFLFYLKQELGTLPIVAHQKYQLKDKKKRSKIFVSYSHADTKFLADVQRHFKPFLSQVDYWDDSKIYPGQKWKEEISKAISETQVAILLVSTDFLGSEFITTNELPPLLTAAEKEGAIILTVILKPCLFEDFPNLNEFQAMNPPSRPVIKMDEADREEFFVNLVRQAKKYLQE